MTQNAYTYGMRIVEPGSREVKPAKKRHKRRIFAGILLLALIAGSFVWLRSQFVSAPESPTINESALLGAEINANTQERKPIVFSDGEAIKEFMDTFAYPNVSEITTKPEITGNIEADNRIRTLAEARGYRQRAIPNTSLVNVDGYLLQQKVVADWVALKKAASEEGLKLAISSAFRPVDEQRQLFVDRLRAVGATNASIAAGDSDNSIKNVLKTTAVPGYSKHHTGFTVDLTCNGIGTEGFAKTPCYTWLTSDNYAVLRKFGWLPSYPSGASLQGPDPEPWEYVWVGVGSLVE